jgi:hypothetical protein
LRLAEHFNGGCAFFANKNVISQIELINKSYEYDGLTQSIVFMESMMLTLRELDESSLRKYDSQRLDLKLRTELTISA